MAVTVARKDRRNFFRTFLHFFLFTSALWFAVSEGKENNRHHTFDEGAEFEKRYSQPSTGDATQITKKFFGLKRNRKSNINLKRGKQQIKCSLFFS